MTGPPKDNCTVSLNIEIHLCVYLIGVNVHIEVLQETRGKFTKQKIVSHVDCSQTPVCVIIGTGTGTERPHCKERVNQIAF